jgi:hypothetical protein
MIEIMTFRLAPGTDEATFLAADRLVQTEFAYHQPGLLRRTTARGQDGAWVVIDLWRSEPDAAACSEIWGHDPITAGFMALVDSATIHVARYETLG